jgi:hypothetical protein
MFSRKRNQVNVRQKFGKIETLKVSNPIFLFVDIPSSLKLNDPFTNVSTASHTYIKSWTIKFKQNKKISVILFWILHKFGSYIF